MLIYNYTDSKASKLKVIKSNKCEFSPLSSIIFILNLSIIGFFLLTFFSFLRGFRFLLSWHCISVYLFSLYWFLLWLFLLFFVIILTFSILSFLLLHRRFFFISYIFFVDYSHRVRKTKSYTEYTVRHIYHPGPVSLRTHKDTLLTIEVLSSSTLLRCIPAGGDYSLFGTQVSYYTADKYCISLSHALLVHQCVRDGMLVYYARICPKYPKQGAQKIRDVGGAKIRDRGQKKSETRGVEKSGTRGRKNPRLGGWKIRNLGGGKIRD